METKNAPQSPDENNPPLQPERLVGNVVIQSDELFSGRTQLTIIHNGEPYQLRITRQQKLILTK
jgi:hemin uptake protein HemP